MPRWLRYKRNLIPILLRESTGRIEIVPSSSRKPTEYIHLPYFGRNGFHVFMGVGTAAAIFAQMRCSMKILVRNSHIPTVRIIGCRAENIAGFGKT